MIRYITGELITVSKDRIIIEQGGIGYELMIPSSAINNLPSPGYQVKVYTYLHVREDILALYAFLTQDDLEVFKLLITVSGIGPKVALGVLSAHTPDDLRFAILSEDVKTITTAPGIGPKTAKKLILELKDKFKLDESFESRFSNSENETSLNITRVREETLEALLVLGYSRTDASNAIRSIEINDETTAEDALRQSLRNII
ncbi:MAG TPA: Holliday junction branch migration protein RuvA [Clostridiales bacterium]|nr:Holliday junction branch migration protein RuvA [Clostridiales bacterium]